MEQVKGYVVATLFHNVNNHYSIIKIRIDQKKDEKLTIVGYFDIPEKNELIMYHGEYVDHERFGRQFKAEFIEKVLPNSNEAVIRFLSSSLFPKVGAKTAEKVVEALGENCLNLIKEDETVLESVDIKDELKQTILNVIKNNNRIEEQIKLFVGYGLNMKEIIKLDAFYGKEMTNVLLSDPYQMVIDIDGIGFKTADRIAKNMNIDEDDPRRLRAAVLYCLDEICFRTQNTYTDVHTLFMTVIKFLPFMNEETFMECFSDLASVNNLIFENNRVYPLKLFIAEKEVAFDLAQFINRKIIGINEEEIYNEIDNIEHRLGIKYESKQVEAIVHAITSGMTIITGGPGTGKTTILKAIIKIFNNLFSNKTIVCCAPTGRAAKRMSELTGVEATTIHRALVWDLDTNQFSKDKDDPLFGDVLIIDEFSMVDINLFYHLLDATQNFKQIILIGDDEQLPPVSPGSVLNELMSMNLENTIKLEKIYRQGEDSGIIPLASDIRVGKLNVENLNKSDVKFINVDKYNLKNVLLSLLEEKIYSGDELQDIQILAPMYDGQCGITYLNEVLREYFNPASINKREMQIGKTIYREGDKVLQLKNQPSDDVYNGDIGFIVEIKNKEEDEEIKKSTITVDFDGNFVTYDYSTFVNLTHAYCISVHKSQGSEYKNVFLLSFWEHRIMLKRKLLYTGITRTKNNLYILGDLSSFEFGIKQEDLKQKNISLKEKLIKLI